MQAVFGAANCERERWEEGVLEGKVKNNNKWGEGGAIMKNPQRPQRSSEARDKVRESAV